jgi:sulfur relay (sulfurtransferase) DsrF/TusC family protein
MANYIFIETRDPFSSTDTDFVLDTATGLRRRGHDVTVFFAQNGVLAVRQMAKNPYVSLLVRADITVLADDFSLCERGILPGELSDGVHDADIGMLVDLLIKDDTRALWH